MGASLPGPSRRGGPRFSPRAEINVTPFVDVMLVLLIVFMVTAPLLTVGVPLDLPQTEARALPSDEEPLTVSIQADCTVFLQETEVEADALVPRLLAIGETGYEERVFVRADGTAEYGCVVGVMARLSAAGFSNIGLVTDPAAVAAAADE
ncbi:MAG: ExbD/TolR family protein [Maricaulaceae bacterium]